MVGTCHADGIPSEAQTFAMGSLELCEAAFSHTLSSSTQKTLEGMKKIVIVVTQTQTPQFHTPYWSRTF